MNTTDQTLNLLRNLVAIPSYVGDANPDSENLIAQYLEQWIKQNIPSLKLTKLPFEKDRSNLYYQGIGNKILFACHMDTIPAQNKDQLNLKIDGDKIHGLGTKDMKGGIVSTLLALKTLEDLGKPINASIIFYGDEEYTQKGMHQIVQDSHKIPKPKLIISPESRFNIGFGCRGVCVIKLSIGGKTAHSARPNQGVDAVKLFYKIYENLSKNLSGETELGETSITISELKGGLLINGELSSQPNMVPDFASGILSLRIAQVGITAQDIIDMIKKIVKSADGEVLSLELANNYPASLTDKKNVESLTNALKKNQMAVEFANPALAGFNDAILLAQKMDVSIVTFGPYGENNHSPKEWVSLKSVMDTTRVFISLLEG